MNAERLLMVADIVDEIPEEQFDMGPWWHRKGCGSVGCAIGHAVRNKRVQKTGLYSSYIDVPIYRTVMGFTAIAAWADIERTEAEYLFSSLRYDDCKPTKEMVAARIRKFVAEHTPQEPPQFESDTVLETEEELVCV